MRIRKRPSTAAASAAASAANVAAATTITEALQLCQLNQSPWDVFPPSPRRRDSYSDDDPEPLLPPPSFPLDTFSGRQRFFAKRTAANVVGAADRKQKRVVFHGGACDSDGSADEFKEEDVVLCPKTDKKGWQCGSVVKKGNSFCEKHLPVTSGKSSGGRKSSANSGEFYYYTGFGPARGKKRGNTATSSTSVKPSEESSTDGGSDGSKNGVAFGKSEFGFDDDDSEDEYDNGRSAGRKRGRRMVRSLKSLM